MADAGRVERRDFETRQAPRLVCLARGPFHHYPWFAGVMYPEGSLTLTDVGSPTLSIVCEACCRRGTYTVKKLIDEHGDKTLTHLLPTLADCPKSRATSTDDGCTMVYEGLTFYEMPRAGWRPCLRQ
jgi:hypothetical protein